MGSENDTRVGRRPEQCINIDIQSISETEIQGLKSPDQNHSSALILSVGVGRCRVKVRAGRFDWYDVQSVMILQPAQLV